MLKKTITYTDYDGNKRTEDFYFNLSKAELMEMEMSKAGGFKNMLESIIASPDSTKIISVFKDLILKAYGVKSDDGRRFIKSPELSAEFSQTEAYSIFFMELANDDDAAAAFVNGLIPSDLAEEMTKSEKAVPKLAK